MHTTLLKHWQNFLGYFRLIFRVKIDKQTEASLLEYARLIYRNISGSQKQLVDKNDQYIQKKSKYTRVKHTHWRTNKIRNFSCKSYNHFDDNNSQGKESTFPRRGYHLQIRKWLYVSLTGQQMGLLWSKSQSTTGDDVSTKIAQKLPVMMPPIMTTAIEQQQWLMLRSILQWAKKREMRHEIAIWSDLYINILRETFTRKQTVKSSLQRNYEHFEGKCRQIGYRLCHRIHIGSRPKWINNFQSFWY